MPKTNPYIQNSTTGAPARQRNITGGAGELVADASYVYRTFSHDPEPAPGGAGVWWKIDSTNFPISKTIASTYVVLEPKGIRELHWHPTVSWLDPSCTAEKAGNKLKYPEVWEAFNSCLRVIWAQIDPVLTIMTLPSFPTLSAVQEGPHLARADTNNG